MSTADVEMDDGVYLEEDIKRSEEFKEKGNQYFKGKIYIVADNYSQTISLSKALTCTQRLFFAKLLLPKSQSYTATEHWPR